jgi:hypothetical protein
MVSVVLACLLTGCLAPLPHPVLLAEPGTARFDVGVDMIGGGFQVSGGSQVGLVQHMQAEVAAGIGLSNQWQAQAGLRGEIPLGALDGLQLAALFDHQSLDPSAGFVCVWCPTTASRASSAPGILIVNLGGGEIGWSHRFLTHGVWMPFGRVGLDSAQRVAALGLFGAVLTGFGRDPSQAGNVLLLQGRAVLELPVQSLNHLSVLLWMSVSGQLPDAFGATPPLNTGAFGLGMLYGT